MIRVTVVGSVGIRAVLADCLVSQEETLVLPVKPQAIAVALPLRSHFATSKVALVPVSRRPQEVTASPRPQGVTASPRPQGVTASPRPQGVTASPRPQG